jgi:energy-coupling factor transport system substrate-specific component
VNASSSPTARIALMVGVNAVGVAAFLWPFVVPALANDAGIDRINAPLVLVVVLACVGGLLFCELGRGGMGPKAVALIGVLGGAMIALRIPGFVAGFSAMFLVVLVAGAAFGPGFGFVLGAVGTFASGLFVGGLGPWLPFQMVAVGWVGAGAGLMPRSGPWTRRIAVLAAYGFASGYLFGAVMNLWSWPFILRGTSLGWAPSAGTATNLRHYMAYYAATSFAWDSFRAVGNAVMIVVLGRPLLASLDRAARRMHVEVDALAPTAGPVTGVVQEPAGVERDSSHSSHVISTSRALDP